MKNPIELAQVIRSNATESVHLGHICLRDNNSKTRTWGDEEFSCFTRSCIKPIQAKISRALLDNKLEGKFLALACGSHLAEEEQMKVVHDFLKEFEIEAEEIQCGSLSKSRGNLSSNLKHNCSAKHIAIIAACKAQGWDSSSYLNIEHPYNKLLIEELQRLSSLREIKIGQDDCGLPSFHMSLKAMSKVFFNLMRDPDYREIISAMNKFPFLIGGQKQIDSLIMSNYPGKFLAKAGAEGLIAICNLEKTQSLIIKIIDGSNRAKGVISSRVLKELNWTDKEILNSKPIFDSKSSLVGTIQAGLKLHTDKD